MTMPGSQPTGLIEIPVDLRSTRFVTDLNKELFAHRLFVTAAFLSKDGRRVNYSCFIDTGAPFAVIPHSLWRDSDVLSTPLGHRNFADPLGRQTPINFFGTRCALRITRVHLIDPIRGTYTGPHSVVGKFVQQPLGGELAHLERAAILGMDFLVRNRIGLAPTTEGYCLTVPVRGRSRGRRHRK